MPGREVRIQRQDCTAHCAGIGVNLPFYQPGPHHPLPVEGIERGMGPA